MGSMDDLLGASPGIAAVRDRIGQLLQRHGDASRLPAVLILGETGTGKSLLARAIHRASPRASGPFVAVNAAAIPETLLEAELFGFERGAFTDAKHAKAGLFQTAHRGTLFLDEVGLLPEALQAKLLTVLEDKTVRRLGSTRAEPVDVWVLAATSADLKAAIRARRFREDLYHRLAVLTVELPPLRERGEDVLLLAEHFLARACADYGLAPMALADDAREALLAYPWPGNVRELGNAMERAALLIEAPVVTAAMLALPAADGAPAVSPREGAPPGREPAEGGEADERVRLLETLDETDWNVSRAAARLGISRNAMRYRMEKHGIRPPAGDRERGFPSPVPASRSSAGATASLAMEAADATRPTAGAEGEPAPAAEGRPAVPAPRVDVRWARRHVALLRVDLADVAEDGPPAGDRTLESAIDKAIGFGARVEALGLTHVVAAFGVEGGEDAPRRAAHAALAVVRDAERRTREAGAPRGVRVGLHVSQMLVGRIGGALQAESRERQTALAALEALVAGARPGEILVSGPAAAFLERRFTFSRDAAAGGPASGGAYRLRGLDPTGLSPGGRMTPFVGREAELAELEREYAEASRGAVRLVEVVGEPGIGKSRLIHEFRRRIEGRGHVVLEGQCESLGAMTPFHPFIEIIRTIFRLGEGESAEAITARLRDGLARLGFAPDEHLPFLQVLLGLDVESGAARGLDAEVVGGRTRDLLERIIRERCRTAPLVLVLDDAHRIDSLSRGLVGALVRDRSVGPLLLICARRPPSGPPAAGPAPTLELRLAPLGREACARLVQDRLRGGAVEERLLDRIVEAADGNPLFAEEMARFVAEDGRFAEAGPQVAIPATLEHLLLARVERLDDAARAFLQAACVVGRRFEIEIVQAVVGAGTGVERALRDLERHGLVFPAADESPGTCVVKHVLVQEVVYRSIAPARRESLHRRVAEAIEWLHAGRLGEWVDVLAHHYARTALVDRTIRYLVLAGQRSLRVYSLGNAHRSFEQAMALMTANPGVTDDGVLADAVLDWIRVYYARGDFRGLVALVSRFRDRFEALGDTRRLSLLLFWLGFAHFFGARCDAATPVLERALALGEAVGDDVCIGHALLALGFTRWVKRGDAPRDTVQRLGWRALGIAEAQGDVSLQTQALHLIGVDALTSGRYREAGEASARLLDLGRKAAATRTVAVGLHLRAWVDLYEQRYPEALERAEEVIRLSPETSRFFASMAKGAALVLMGRSREGVALLREIRREIVAKDYLVLLTGLDYPYGVAMVLSGHVGAGIRWIEAAIRRFAGWGNETVPAAGHMILGEIFLGLAEGRARPPLRVLVRNIRFLLVSYPFAAVQARRHLERAVRLARELDIPPVLARSLLGLGQLCLSKGRADEARMLLDEALRVAEPLDLPVLTARIRKALAGGADAHPSGTTRRTA